MEREHQLEYPSPETSFRASSLDVVDETLLAVAGRIWELERATAFPGHQRKYAPPALKELRRSPLGQDLLAIVAFEERFMLSEARVERAMKHVYRAVFGECLSDGYTVPASFHHTTLGKLFNEVSLLLYGVENLMTPVQAYRELGIARQTLYDRVKKGTLQIIYVYGEARFLRAEIEAWKEQRERRKKASKST